MVFLLFLLPSLHVQYMLYGPLLGGALYSWMREDGYKESLYLHILIICGLRGFTHQLWFSFSNLLFLTRNRIINKRGVDFEQIDREWHWDNFIILHAFMAVWAPGHATPLEHIILGVIMSIPLVGPTLMGCGSTSLVYGYVLICMGHSNVEVIPHQLFESFPFLRYLLYTAT
ncbi:sterol desaturase [Asimina triloba]